MRYARKYKAICWDNPILWNYFQPNFHSEWKYLKHLILSLIKPTKWSLLPLVYPDRVKASGHELMRPHMLFRISMRICLRKCYSILHGIRRLMLKTLCWILLRYGGVSMVQTQLWLTEHLPPKHHAKGSRTDSRSITLSGISSTRLYRSVSKEMHIVRTLCLKVLLLLWLRLWKNQK
jgi:hypothetical protein